MNLLIIDENEVSRRQLFWAVRQGNEVHEAASRKEAGEILTRLSPDIVLMELLESGDSNEQGGVALVERLMREPSFPLIIIITRSNRKEIAAQLLNLGVFDFFTKPLDMNELPVVLRRAERQRELRASPVEGGGRSGAGVPVVPSLPEVEPGIIGVENRIKDLLDQVRRIAPTPVSVLITGETGTGKEIFANAIHSMSDRHQAPFVALNCAVLSDTLVEDELFGHEKGAFTGAIDRRKGRFEQANNGTLFLDEIGDLSLPLQSKFLRVLQEKQFERLGGSEPLNTDFRLICATHRDLSAMTREGSFREDLMFRLNVVSLHLPPLRERRGDIRLLAHHFLEEYGRAFKRRDKLSFSREVLRYMVDYPWPGNIRELKHFVERAVALTDGSVIGMEVIPEPTRPNPEGDSIAREGGDLEGLVKKYKRKLVMEALEMAGHNKIQTAQILGISKSHLFKLINQLSIPKSRGKKARSG